MSLTPSDRLPPELASALPAARFQILYFMRTADCAVCKSHVRRLVALQPTLASLGAAVTIFAPDAEPPAWAKTTPLPLVLGPAAYDAAGFGRTLAIQQSGTIVAQRGVVLDVRRATLPFRALDERALLGLLREAGAAAAA